MIPTKYAVTATVREAVQEDRLTRNALKGLIRETLQTDLETRGIVRYLVNSGCRQREWEIDDKMDSDDAKRLMAAAKDEDEFGPGGFDPRNPDHLDKVAYGIAAPRWKEPDGMTPSLINAINGLPADARDGFRLFILTAWTYDGLLDALVKFEEMDRKAAPKGSDRWVYPGKVVFSKHCGENSDAAGPVWFSCPVWLHKSDFERERGKRRTSRYGMTRWQWTGDSG